MDWEGLGISSLLENSIALQALGLIALIFVSWIGLLITRRILMVAIRSVAMRTAFQWDDRLVDAQLFIRLAHLAPALILYHGSALIPELDDTISTLIRRVSAAAVTL